MRRSHPWHCIMFRCSSPSFAPASPQSPHTLPTAAHTPPFSSEQSSICQTACLSDPKHHCHTPHVHDPSNHKSRRRKESFHTCPEADDDLHTFDKQWGEVSQRFSSKDTRLNPHINLIIRQPRSQLNLSNLVDASCKLIYNMFFSDRDPDSCISVPRHGSHLGLLTLYLCTRHRPRQSSQNHGKSMGHHAPLFFQSPRQNIWNTNMSSPGPHVLWCLIC